jgi:hypothetical protein
MSNGSPSRSAFDQAS